MGIKRCPPKNPEGLWECWGREVAEKLNHSRKGVCDSGRWQRRGNSVTPMFLSQEDGRDQWGRSLTPQSSTKESSLTTVHRRQEQPACLSATPTRSDASTGGWRGDSAKVCGPDTSSRLGPQAEQIFAWLLTRCVLTRICLLDTGFNKLVKFQKLFSSPHPQNNGSFSSPALSGHLPLFLAFTPSCSLVSAEHLPNQPVLSVLTSLRPLGVPSSAARLSQTFLIGFPSHWVPTSSHYHRGGASLKRSPVLLP